uniref:Calcyphosin-like protein n=1 Tax=Macrostomum lignano TaxID=282301 RepID=A0A1I8GLT4_9PLAT
MVATDRGSAELAAKAKKQLASGKAADPLEKLRLVCLSRGASGIEGIGRQFRIIDDDGSRSLDRREFYKGCTDFGADLSKEEMDQIFDRIDKDRSGPLDFDEFLQALRPPMSSARRELITKAFKKLDRTGDGVITVEDLRGRGVYNCKHHPKYQNGQWTEDDVFKEFLRTFETPNDADGVVTKEEFFNYYSGVSASVDNDAYFDLMMRNAYKIWYNNAPATAFSQ